MCNNKSLIQIKDLEDRKLFFLNVGPPKESIILTTFYGLYFSHQYTNILITFTVLDMLRT